MKPVRYQPDEVESEGSGLRVRYEEATAFFKDLSVSSTSTTRWHEGRHSLNGDALRDQMH